MIKSGLAPLSGALAAVVSFAFVATAVSAPPDRPRVQEVDLELGKEIYRSQCLPCHGAKGKGDGPAARFLESKPRDLTAGTWLYVEEATVEKVSGIVKYGIADTEMEPFEELLLEEEMIAVAAFVVAEFAGELP